MRSITIFAIAFVAIFCLPVFAIIINVPDDYSTIQAGIDASTEGDTVLVQPGTYYENINFNGYNIVLGSLFLTTEDTSFISQTIIDGGSEGTVITFNHQEGSQAALCGFKIQNGLCDSSGGGIYCSYSGPVISNNLIVENVASEYGGGIYCYDSRAIVDKNIIDGNTAAFSGGGILCRTANAIIVDNIISNNIANDSSWISDGGGISCIDQSASIIKRNLIEGNISMGTNGGRGGGIACVNSNPIIDLNIIKSNSAGFGAGVCLMGSNPSIRNNIVANNSASGNGGGFHFIYAMPVLENNTIYGNYALRGGAITGFYNSAIQVINSVLWADTASQEGQEIFNDSTSTTFAVYGDIRGGWPGGGNIDIDPLFRDPDNGDFHLMATYCGDPYDSPCIDMGNPDIADSLLDCDWGLGELRSDMGAYGGRGDQVGINDHHYGTPDKIALMQNYPNPFNASTMIRYELPEQARVKLDICDILGREVTTIEDDLRPAGYHQVLWRADAVASGIYFYRLRTGDIAETKKMVLMK